MLSGYWYGSGISSLWLPLVGIWVWCGWIGLPFVGGYCCRRYGGFPSAGGFGGVLGQGLLFGLLGLTCPWHGAWVPRVWVVVGFELGWWLRLVCLWVFSVRHFRVPGAGRR